MKTLSFNIIKPLAFTALFIVFAASFNTASACDIENDCTGDNCTWTGCYCRCID